MNYNILYSRCLKVVVIFLFMTLLGCVTKSAEKTTDKPVFFPAPPDPPRYQFLRSFSGTGDFEEEDTGLDSFLGKSTNVYNLKKPYGVSMSSSGVMYVVDTQNSVWRFDLKNKKVNKLPGDKGLGKLIQPINLAIDDKGNKYIADPIRNAVIKYDKNDFYVRAYVSPDPWKPVAPAIYDGLLYVVDSTHHDGGIKVFDLKSGDIIDTIGRTNNPEHNLVIASNLVFDDDGYLYVMDAGRFQVVKYDRDGHYRGHLGAAGDGPGFFGRPRGIAVDKEGRIYTVDAAFDVVQVFSDNGQLLAILGGPGTTPGTLTLPAGIHIDYDNVNYFKEYAAPGFEIEYLVFVTSQFHNTNGISVYGYGKKNDKKYKSDDVLRDELVEDLKRKQEQ